ncbi:MAG: glycosyltransferase [Candidatus Bathyarchaeia archaeon]
MIIFTWEFPPRIIGALAHYVNRLAVELVRKNMDTYVLTFHDSWTGYHEGTDGVKAYRISNPVRAQQNIITWVLSLNPEIERTAADIYYQHKREVDLIDVHDWHFVPAAVNLKKALNLPFTFSVDSLEDHRSHGSTAPLNLSIKSIEWLGTKEAEKVIVKSEWMKEEVSRIYKVSSEKIIVVSPYSQSWIDEIIESYRKAIKAPNVFVQSREVSA